MNKFFQFDACGHKIDLMNDEDVKSQCDDIAQKLQDAVNTKDKSKIVSALRVAEHNILRLCKLTK